MNPTRISCFAALLALSTVGCSSEPEEVEPKPVLTFTPAESEAPAVNRIIVSELQDASTAANELTLAVDAEDIDRLYGGTFTLLYDPEVVTIDELNPGELLADGFLVSSLEREEATPGELAIGFSLGAAPGDIAVSGRLATLSIHAQEADPSGIDFLASGYANGSRVRALVAVDGVAIAGTRWLGGSLVWVVPEPE